MMQIVPFFVLYRITQMDFLSLFFFVYELGGFA